MGKREREREGVCVRGGGMKPDRERLTIVYNMLVGGQEIYLRGQHTIVD